MQKTIDINTLDIPIDDIDCWDKYPKHRWVYDLSRLLDAQNVKWSPYQTTEFDDRVTNIGLYTIKPIIMSSNYIYIKKVEGQEMYTEVYITKGEIKLMRHINPETGLELDTIIGEIELRLNAFVTLYFQKFTGVISARTISHDIYAIQLRPLLSGDTNAEALKLKKRIYKKNSITLNGLTDQVHHESLTS